jgi:hypothetical protein
MVSRVSILPNATDVQEPTACVERLQCLQEQLPSMYQCILEFNRRGRIPSAKIRESMRLFAEQVMPKLCNVPVAV